MSRAWTRVGIDEVCGQCGASIPAGEPVQRITIPGVRRAFVRCVACEGPAPAAFAPPPVRAPAPVLPFARFSAAALPIDWKQKASGE